MLRRGADSRLYTRNHPQDASGVTESVISIGPSIIREQRALIAERGNASTWHMSDNTRRCSQIPGLRMGIIASFHNGFVVQSSPGDLRSSDCVLFLSLAV